MFNLEDAYSNITLEDVFSRISEEDLWRRYCSNFKKIDVSFLSELYNDKRPSCRIYEYQNKLFYKDFGTAESYSIIDYIQRKYNCTFKESINIIANDFGLRTNTNLKCDLRPKIDVLSVLNKKVRSTIQIESQGFKLADFSYWDQYHIPLELLEEYNVLSAKVVYLIKPTKIITFRYNIHNPIYAYEFIHEGEISYKIYFPYAAKSYKWLFNGGTKDNIEGYDQLPLIGNKLILTKSLKDCMIYNLIGLPAISLQGEANKLDSELVNKLLKRFNQIIVNYDKDEEGIRGSKRLNNQYGFNYFYVDKYKDISDYCKEEGLKKTKEMIKRKIEEVDGSNSYKLGTRR